MRSPPPPACSRRRASSAELPGTPVFMAKAADGGYLTYTQNGRTVVPGFLTWGSSSRSGPPADTGRRTGVGRGEYPRGAGPPAQYVHRSPAGRARHRAPAGRWTRRAPGPGRACRSPNRGARADVRSLRCFPRGPGPGAAPGPGAPRPGRRPQPAHHRAGVRLRRLPARVLRPGAVARPWRGLHHPGALPRGEGGTGPGPLRRGTGVRTVLAPATRLVPRGDSVRSRSRTTSGRPTSGSSWSSPTAPPCGGRTPGATTGPSTSAPGACASWAGRGPGRPR